MKKIYKYPLRIADEQIVRLPSTNILSVESQLNDIVVYALVDPDDLKVSTYEFRIHGTGHEIKDDINAFKFLGTIKMHDGILMFHVFYKQI